MRNMTFTFKEKIYLNICTLCRTFDFFPRKIHDWSMDKLNKSYYKNNPVFPTHDDISKLIK